MQIEFIKLVEIRMHLKAPFETSFGTTWERRIALIEIGSDGLSGWGEVTTTAGPFYNAETTETACHIIREFIVPLVLGKKLRRASEVASLMSPIRGQEMAKASVENALWDIEAQQRGVPLSALLGGTRNEIPCGVSIGIQDSTATLLSKIQTELEAGYQRIKIKIKPGKDFELISAIRKNYPTVPLMVDANSAYQLYESERLRMFDGFELMMIEQPLAWDDIYQHSLLQKQLRTPICLDECIHNSAHAEAAIGLRACGIINIKLGRVGGYVGAKSVHDVCTRNSIPTWCGGMLESGIGRAHNIALSTLEGFVLPGDVSASQRYWEEDIIDPEVEITSRGTIVVRDQPGLGYSVRRDRVEKCTVRQQQWNARSLAVVPANQANAAEQ